MKITRTMSFRMDWINSNHAGISKMNWGSAWHSLLTAVLDSVNPE